MSFKLLNKSGVTVVEMIVAVVIGAIALLALAIPFAAERSYWNSGARQIEAQRDAQMALRAMTKMARQSQSYTITTVSGGNVKINFVVPSCGTVYFQGGANYPSTGKGQFVWQDGCLSTPSSLTLIDGVRSKVSSFTATKVSSKIIKVNLSILYKNQSTENLEKQVFLRNAT